MVPEGSMTPVDGGETDGLIDPVEASPVAVPEGAESVAGGVAEAGHSIGQILLRVVAGAVLVFVSGGLALFHFFGWYGVAGAGVAAVCGGAALASAKRTKKASAPRGGRSSGGPRKATTGAGRAAGGGKTGGSPGRKLLGGNGSKASRGKAPTAATSSRMPGLPKLGKRRSTGATGGTAPAKAAGKKAGTGRKTSGGGGTSGARKGLRNPFSKGGTSRASKAGRKAAGGGSSTGAGTAKKTGTKKGRIASASSTARKLASTPVTAGKRAWRGGKKAAAKIGTGARRTGTGVKKLAGKTAGARGAVKAGGRSALNASRAGSPLRAVKTAWKSSRGKRTFGKAIGTLCVLAGALLLTAGRPLWNITGRPIKRRIEARWAKVRAAVSTRIAKLRGKSGSAAYGSYPCSCGAVYASPQELVSCRARHEAPRTAVPPAKFQEPIIVPAGSKPAYTKENPMFDESSNIDEDSGMLAVREQMGKDADAAEEGLARAKRWQAIVENGPFNQDVKDAAEDQVNMFKMSCEGMSELVGIFDTSHADDIERLETPRTNEQLWDHSLNQD